MKHPKNQPGSQVTGGDERRSKKTRGTKHIQTLGLLQGPVILKERLFPSMTFRHLIIIICQSALGISFPMGSIEMVYLPGYLHLPQKSTNKYTDPICFFRAQFLGRVLLSFSLKRMHHWKRFPLCKKRQEGICFIPKMWWSRMASKIHGVDVVVDIPIFCNGSFKNTSKGWENSPDFWLPSTWHDGHILGSCHIWSP